MLAKGEFTFPRDEPCFWLSIGEWSAWNHLYISNKKLIQQVVLIYVCIHICMYVIYMYVCEYIAIIKKKRLSSESGGRVMERLKEVYLGRDEEGKGEC